MAQQVEHVLGKDGVTGSNPVSSSKKGTVYMAVPFLVLAFATLGKCSIKNTAYNGGIFCIYGCYKRSSRLSK